MSMGMTYKEFWEGDNDLPKFYRKKHEYDLQHMNEMAYLQGVYVAKAISACFSNGEFKYPDKPDLLNLSINKEIIAEEEKLQAEQYTKQLREYMQMLGNNSLKAKEKKQNGDTFDMAEYEGLEFTVTEDISKSVKDIKRLSSALKDLKSALEAVKGMDVGKELKNLSDQLSEIEGKDTSTLKELGEALRNTGDGVSKLNKTIQAMDISKFKDNMHGIAESVKELDLDRLSKLSEATQGLRGLSLLHLVINKM